ncbi:DNA topology modulation protein [Clostridium sediminicola]|uniref:topology modulation protein n=1 Tax=Clostridium sediminicola TaxID=3114879 RepID=UPI0031F23F5B
MQKIMILGSGGAGKSTSARNLSKITGIKVFYMDKLFWKPGWVSIPRDELKEKLKSITKLDSWIIDGNYRSTIDVRLKEADTVIYLDFSTWLCLWGIVKRRFLYSRKMRPDITEGCKEKIDLEFFMWVLNFRRKNRKEILKMIRNNCEEKSVYIFKNRRELEKFVGEVNDKL